MAEAEDIKKLPFANYDIVVYFGVGVLSLPLLLGGIVRPFGIGLPTLSVPIKNEFASTAVATLAALFGGYAVGHVLAFLASYFVEKFVHRTLGYPSGVYIKQCNAGVERIKYVVDFKRLIGSLPMLVMIIFHIPMLPFYAAVYYTQSFGFYTPKTNLVLRETVVRKLRVMRLPINVDESSRWTKVLEHYVANNCPQGYARMYNYLVIYGCMRSISMLCIIYVWFYVANGITKLSWSSDGTLAGVSFRTPQHPIFYGLGYILVGGFALFAVMSFAKFNRRYFEEALQAFCLAGDKTEPKIRTIG